MDSSCSSTVLQGLYLYLKYLLLSSYLGSFSRFFLMEILQMSDHPDEIEQEHDFILSVKSHFVICLVRACSVLRLN